MTNLRFVALIVPSPSRILDLCDMGMLSNIGGVLDDYTVGSNVGNDTLHHLELWDVPVFNGLVPLAYTSICIDYGRFVLMKFIKSCPNPVAAFVINLLCLAKIPEIH